MHGPFFFFILLPFPRYARVNNFIMDDNFPKTPVFFSRAHFFQIERCASLRDVVSSLNREEQFLVEIYKLPRLPEKLELFVFKENFPILCEQIDSVSSPLVFPSVHSLPHLDMLPPPSSPFRSPGPFHSLPYIPSCFLLFPPFPFALLSPHLPLALTLTLSLPLVLPSLILIQNVACIREAFSGLKSSTFKTLLAYTLDIARTLTRGNTTGFTMGSLNQVFFFSWESAFIYFTLRNL
jgi:hypothetical protein